MSGTPPATEPSVPETEKPPEAAALTFKDLGLAEAVVRAVDEVGYEAPSAIQAAAIPPLLAGRDLLGQAQTGTGKTAAFTLPLLSRLDASPHLQILVLTPTRELALQVAEAMQTYARHIPGFHVLPVYGGQGMDTQLRQLKRGVHAVVGTPGRIQDHLRRGTLKLDRIFAVVLDEADEMLRMGFLEEVEAILQHTPAEKQVALFSATLPAAIQKVARRYLRDPVEVRIAAKTATVAAVSQRYWPVVGVHKLDALTRILEAEDFDGMLVFVRTKVATTELAEKLEARGFACSALNGDMNQALRERAVERLRNGQLDIVVATDVAARGLDVERISHVVNYDMPNDVESYVHRIGRTGRAGRGGVAILFVAPREQSALRAIENATRQTITRISLPTREDIAGKRIARFKRKVQATLAEQDLDFLTELIEEIEKEQETSPERIGAALAYLLQKDRPLVPELAPEPSYRAAPSARGESSERVARSARGDEAPRASPPRGVERPIPPGLGRYRLEVGSAHGVQAKNIVGALCNEASLDGKQILNLDIRDAFSLVDLPLPLPGAVLRRLKTTRIRGQELQIQLLAKGGAAGTASLPGSQPRLRKGAPVRAGSPYEISGPGGKKPAG
jgi:ATP-dependent RNA helicase DeaD